MADNFHTNQEGVKIVRYADVPKFTRRGNWEVDVPFTHIERSLASFQEDMGLDLDPDFQRGHVWTREQQTRWVEFLMRGGESNTIIYFNCPCWNHEAPPSPVQIVDGKQRLEAVRAFMRGEVPAFGSYVHEWDVLRSTELRLKFNVNDLKTRAQVLTWYLDLNSGGTPHSAEEIQKVRQMLQEEINKEE